ncbi:MAG: peptide ABC transporter substrate-binding protein [Firmicutes bacterium]|nr:peptide ABC transporter substrate-binding protein [Bacillota bacterium]
MKRLFTLIILLLLLSLLAACVPLTAQPEEAEELRLSLCVGPEPASLDPQTAGDAAAGVYSLQLFEGLLRYVPTAAPAGGDPAVSATETAAGQAESWEVSEDGLTWVFHLRPDACWSDGTPVTAGDFVFAWQRLVDPALALPGGELLRGVIEGAAAALDGSAAPSALAVTAADDRTLTVRLEQTRPDFAELTARPALSPLPAALVREYGAQWATAEHFAGNGPFAPAVWSAGYFLKLTPNTYYYDREQVGPDELFFWFRDTESEVLAAYEEGQCGFILNFPTEAAASLTASGDCHALPRPGQCLLLFSCHSLPDWRVRAALALTVDRERLCRELQGGQSVAAGLVDCLTRTAAGGSFRELSGDVLERELAAAFPEADLQTLSGRRELARQLLAQAEAGGFDSSRPLKLIGSDSDAAVKLVSCLREDLAAIGLELEMAALDQDALGQALAAGDFDLARLAPAAEQTDALTWLGLFRGSGRQNYGGWQSPAYDALLEQIDGAAGAERDELLAQAEQALFAPGAWVCLPLYDFGCQYCLRDVTGVAYAPRAGFLFRQARPAEAAE